MPLDCAAFVHICAAAAFEYLASVLVHGLSFQFIPINHRIQFIVQILYKIPQTMFTEVSSAFHSQLLLHSSSRQTNKKETTEHLFHYSARTWNVVFIFIFPSYLEMQNQLLHCWHAQMTKEECAIKEVLGFPKHTSVAGSQIKKLTGRNLLSPSKTRHIFQEGKRR